MCFLSAFRCSLLAELCAASQLAAAAGDASCAKGGSRFCPTPHARCAPLTPPRVSGCTQRAAQWRLPRLDFEASTALKKVWRGGLPPPPNPFHWVCQVAGAPLALICLRRAALTLEAAFRPCAQGSGRPALLAQRAWMCRQDHTSRYIAITITLALDCHHGKGGYQCCCVMLGIKPNFLAQVWGPGRSFITRSVLELHAGVPPDHGRMLFWAHALWRSQSAVTRAAHRA